jgi:hypothetical protein
MSTHDDGWFFARGSAFDLDFVDPEMTRIGKWLGILWAGDASEALRLCEQVEATAEAAARPGQVFDGAKEWRAEADTARAVLRRRLALEALLARGSNPSAIVVSGVNPATLPEPRRWCPYPNLGRKLQALDPAPGLTVTVVNESDQPAPVQACKVTSVVFGALGPSTKLEAEEILGTFVSLARERGFFGWARPDELLEHARKRDHQWAGRPFGTPSLQRDGVERGTLESEPDPDDAGKMRYRLSATGLLAVVAYLVDYARKAAAAVESDTP